MLVVRAAVASASSYLLMCNSWQDTSRHQGKQKPPWLAPAPPVCSGLLPQLTCRCGSSWSVAKRRCSASCCMLRAAAACWRRGWPMRSQVGLGTAGHVGCIWRHRKCLPGSCLVLCRFHHPLHVNECPYCLARPCVLGGHHSLFVHFRSSPSTPPQRQRRCGIASRWSRPGWGSWKGFWPLPALIR